MIAIEDNVPLPPLYQKSIYPFKELEVGQSFLVKWNNLSGKADNATGSLRSLSWYYGKMMGRKFSTRATKEGFRVWRTR